MRNTNIAKEFFIVEHAASGDKIHRAEVWSRSIGTPPKPDALDGVSLHRRRNSARLSWCSRRRAISLRSWNRHDAQPPPVWARKFGKLTIRWFVNPDRSEKYDHGGDIVPEHKNILLLHFYSFSLSYYSRIAFPFCQNNCFQNHRQSYQHFSAARQWVILITAYLFFLHEPNDQIIRYNE